MREIKLLIDKNVNSECQDIKCLRPIHYVCRFQTKNIIQLLIDKEVNLECEDDQGFRPIHFICQYQTYDTAKLLLDKNVNINCERLNKLLWTPNSHRLLSEDLQNKIFLLLMIIKRKNPIN